MQEAKSGVIGNAVLTAFFILFLFLPLVVGVLEKDKLSSKSEKRSLAVFPSFPSSIEQLIQYPSSLNTYYADHFGFREKLTKRYFRLMRKFGDGSQVEHVTTGKDGWLFLGSAKPGYDKYEDPFGDAMHVNLYTEDELKQFANALVSIKNRLAEQGVAYLFVLAPNKHTIYFDHMPEHIVKQNAYSATDQLFEYLTKHTDVAVLDLRPSLFKEKERRQVYYKYDTHWNHYGANIAQYEIMKAVQSLLPELSIKPFLLSDEQFTQTTFAQGDLGVMLNMGEDATEETPRPVWQDTCPPGNLTPDSKDGENKIFECETQELRAIVFRDSFYSMLQPYMARQFARSLLIWKTLDLETLDRHLSTEKPHIVIEEVVERILPYVPRDFVQSD